MNQYLENLREKYMVGNSSDKKDSFFSYINYSILNVNKEVPDLDVSKEANEFYKKYNVITKFSGETLTSAQTFINAILNCNLNTINEKLDLSEKDKFKRMSRKNCIRLYECDSNLFSNLLSESESITELLEICHSLSNFSYIPENFNAGRSGCYADWDNWNTTLFFISKWYKKNSEIKSIDDKIIVLDADIDLINLFDRHIDKYYNFLSKGKSIINTKQWLKNFENVEEFCKKNFFKCYLDEEGKVRELYKGQFYNEYGREKDYKGIYSNDGFVTIPSNMKIEDIDKIIDVVVEIIKCRAKELEANL